MLRRTLDYGDKADALTVRTAMKELGINRYGLDAQDRALLQVLREANGDAVGLEVLAARVGEDPRTVETLYEPYLLRAGVLGRGSRGRFLMKFDPDMLKEE